MWVKNKLSDLGKSVKWAQKEKSSGHADIKYMKRALKSLLLKLEKILSQEEIVNTN